MWQRIRLNHDAAYRAQAKYFHDIAKGAILHDESEGKAFVIRYEPRWREGQLLPGVVGRFKGSRGKRSTATVSFEVSGDNANQMREALFQERLM